MQVENADAEMLTWIGSSTTCQWRWMELSSYSIMYKKLSYHRETARQLPTWGEARTSSPPPPLLATPMHMVESETRNKRTSSVPSIKRTLR